MWESDANHADMLGPSRSLLLFRSIYAIPTSVSKRSVFFVFETGGLPYEMDRPPAVPRAPVGIAEHPGLPADHHLTTFSSRPGWLIVFNAPTFFYNHHKQRGKLCIPHNFPRCIIEYCQMSQFSDNCDAAAWFADFWRCVVRKTGAAPISPVV